MSYVTLWPSLLRSVDVFSGCTFHIMNRTGIGLFLFCLGLCCATGQTENVARGKTCAQSSYYDSDRQCTDAINGDTTSDYKYGNCIHSRADDYTPWWEVNLGRKYPVYKIDLWARTKQIYRMYPFTITVDGERCARRTTTPNTVGISVTCSSVIYGRVVRLTRDEDTGSESQYLNMCEFKVEVPSGVSECPVGRYGSQCNHLCNDNCGGGPGNNFCNQNTGVCYDGCHGNFAGDYCTSCYGNFAGNLCTDCKVGFHGSNCNQRCSSNCAGGCNKDSGDCTNCKVGFYGSNCNQECSSNCDGGCNKGNGDCTSCYGNFAGNLCTDCKVGFHGSNCNQRCNSNCAGGCNKDSGDCTSCYGNFAGNLCTDCKVGFHGSNCNQRCNSNCAGGCNKDSGDCTSCKQGYRGSQCQLSCSGVAAGCAVCSQNGQTCSACQIGFQYPSCTGCVDGWYGNMCDQRCYPSLCQRCRQDGGQCEACFNNMEHPDCTECQTGYYKQYPNQCSRCTWECYNNETCDRMTGNCARCPPGQDGDRCQLSCSDQKKYGQDCSESCGQCQNDIACEAVTGACPHCQPGLQLPLCKQECDNGFYDVDCNKTCGHCKDRAACDKVTGQCPLCEPGWYPPLCDRECQDGYYGVNCTQKCATCEMNAVCDKITGYCACPKGKQPPRCDTDCLEKTYGQDCKESCGQCKGGQPCDTVTGECSSGCDAGWTDQNCQTACPSGTYGDSCNKTCGNCQENSACNHVTGECQAGCAAGFTGSSCLEALEDEPSNAGAIAGAVVGVVLAVVIAVVVIIVIRKRKQGAKSAGYTDGPAGMSSGTDNGDNPTYANTDHSSLSFSPVVTDKPDSKPKAQVKPTVKPPVKTKPAQPAKTDENVYQNFTPQNMGPSTKPSSSKTGQAKASENELRTASEAASKQKGKPVKPIQGRASKAEAESVLEPQMDDEEGKPAEYYNSETPYDNLEPTSIHLENLQSVVQRKLKTGKLETEFPMMNPNKGYPVTNGAREANYYKNRFNSILPYDKSRVELQQVDGDDSSDYINASFIKGYKREKAYIAAQGPKVNTQDDFWRMVWQERVTDIVMLTNLKEGAKTKCYEYWPAKETSINTGHMEVTALEEETRANFVIRTFDLKQLEGKKKRRVKQYHYLSWMDHEVPSTTPLVNFWRYVRARAPRSTSAPPLVVHCSAGVGRTGTYIALDIVIDHAQEAPEVSIYDIVDRLREDRCHMVQNKGQYEFLHEAVMEAYKSRDTRLQTSAFDSTFPLTISHGQPYTPIDKEFQTLTEMREILGKPIHTSANQDENRAKNRNPASLPDERHTVYLTEHVKGRNQYINAVYMPTFFEPRGSIVTQLPLPDTLVDMWRLVDGCDVNTIVSLGKVEGQKDMCRYWPKDHGETMTTGKYTITMESSAKIGQYRVNYNVTMQKDGKSRAVRVLHYAGWTGEVADNTTDLIQLLTTLHATPKEQAGKPVIVQCIDGSARSGMFCALWDVFCRMVCDGEVDVFLAVRQVHSVIPQAVTSSKQYHFCYEVVQQYLNSQNVYANT